MTKCKITPSLVSLAQELRAALIENMFGVTTSDDYRPVAWMGRYPVDVTTMLVGIHVAAAILAAILVAIRSWGCFAHGCNSTAHAIWSSGAGLAAFYLCLRSSPIGAALVRDRDVPAVRIWPRGGTFSRPTRLHRALRFVATHAGGAADDLGTMGTVRNCRFDSSCTLEFLLRLPRFIRASNCCCGSKLSGSH